MDPTDRIVLTVLDTLELVEGGTCLLGSFSPTSLSPVIFGLSPSSVPGPSESLLSHIDGINSL